jgi:hypothetical protein
MCKNDVSHSDFEPGLNSLKMYFAAATNCLVRPARVKLIGQAVILLYCVIQLVDETLEGVNCRNCGIRQPSAVDPGGAVG